MFLVCKDDPQCDTLVRLRLDGQLLKVAKPKIASPVAKIERDWDWSPKLKISSIIRTEVDRADDCASAAQFSEVWDATNLKCTSGPLRSKIIISAANSWPLRATLRREER